MGGCRLANDYWRALLLGARDNDAPRWRRLCFFARSIWEAHRIPVWLDFVSGDSNRDHRRGSDCVREISRRFCHGSFAGKLSGRSNFIRQLRGQPFQRTIGRDWLDRIAHLDEHARA